MSSSEEQDDFDAACHQRDLDERRSWEAHWEYIRAWQRFQQEMDEKWDEIEREMKV